MQSRSKNTQRNIVAGIVNKVIALVLPFICRTIFIKLLNAEYLGLNSLFTAILQVLNMAELGFSSAVVFSMYKPMAEGNKEEVCALLLFYRHAYRIVGMVISIIGLAILPLLPKLISGSYPSDINIYVLYCIYLADTSLSYFAYSYKNSILIASQRQDVISNIDSIRNIIQNLVKILILLIWRNYYIYVASSLFFTIGQNIWIAVITRKMYPEYVCRGKILPETQKSITKQIKGLMVGKVSLVARNSFDSIVLSMFCGLVEVAIYSNYYYVITAVSGVLSVIIQAITASVGNSIATEDIYKNHYDYKRFNFVYSIVICVCTACMYCLYQPFMTLWAGNELVLSNYTMTLFCIYFYIGQMGQIRAMYATAAGMWWEFRFLSIGEMFGNLILNFVLGYLWGINGIIWATIITVTLFSLIGVTKITFNKLFKKSAWDYWKDALIYIVITIVACLISNYICKYIVDNSIIYLALRCIVVMLIVALIYGVILLTNKERRDYFISVIANVIKK